MTRIAIHHRPDSYSDLWIEYCQKHNIQYKVVDAYANDVLEQLADCDAFMWHFHHNIYKDYLFAQQLIYIIEKQMGKITYPNYDTCWHFDDKVGQKYLLEATIAPLVPTYVLYRKNEAFEYIQHMIYPKVFKLRSGASSKNVQLIENKIQAEKLVKKAFCCGFQNNNHWIRVLQRWKQYRRGNCTFKWLIKGIVSPYPYKERFNKKETGYVYFQDFIPNNNYDIRVLIIGNHAVAKKRMNRENDFRASGSGKLIFDDKQIDIEYIKTAFNINRDLKMQSVAFDFLKDENDKIVLSEISYCCSIESNKGYTGYWTENLQWHECKDINICNWIIEDVIEKTLTK